MPSALLQDTANGLQFELPGFRYWVKVGMGVALGVMLMSAIASIVGFIVIPGVFMALLRTAFH